MSFIPNNIYLHIAIILVSFYLLARTADLLVEGAVGVAYRLKVPKIVIGVLLVGFMTTVPEFSVSMISAVQGHPGIAFGNGVGSVIADSLALALGILCARSPIPVDRRVLRNAGLFLIGVDVVVFFLSLGGAVSRASGILLVSVHFPGVRIRIRAVGGGCSGVEQVGWDKVRRQQLCEILFAGRLG